MTGETSPRNNSYNEHGYDYESDDQELNVAMQQIWDIAQEHGLDPFPTHFEVAPANIIYQVGAYGIPGKFTHWTYGRQYRQSKTMYDHGMSKIYEHVINSNPAQAYLLENNPPTENKFIMAHVFGHTDFFKNNVMFGNTRRDMPEAVARQAERVDSYANQYGEMAVEELLDATLALQWNLDPYLIERPSRDDELAAWKKRAEDKLKPVERPVGQFSDLFEIGKTSEPISTPQALGRRALMMMPPEPDRDLLGFIRNHAPYLEDWQRDTIDIVRQESLYFYPQMRTKIMNEGWAAYWHKRLMLEMSERGNLRDDEDAVWWRLHSGVVAPNPKQLNPYYLGMKIYEYIEDYYNGNLTPQEEAWLQSQGKPIYPHYDGPLKDSPAMPHLRSAMMYNDDQSFIATYFDKNVSDRMEMFLYETRNVFQNGVQKEIKVVAPGGWEKIRDILVQQRNNNGMPVISVADGDYGRTGELYLDHAFDGRSLDPEYVNKTLPHLYRLWQRPVHLETRPKENDKKLVYTYDGKRITTTTTYLPEAERYQ